MWRESFIRIKLILKFHKDCNFAGSFLIHLFFLLILFRSLLVNLMSKDWLMHISYNRIDRIFMAKMDYMENWNYDILFTDLPSLPHFAGDSRILKPIVVFLNLGFSQSWFSQQNLKQYKDVITQSKLGESYFHCKKSVTKMCYAVMVALVTLCGIICTAATHQKLKIERCTQPSIGSFIYT